MESGIVYNIQRMSTKDGPGLRTTVFLKGCPLRCLWCSNPESQAIQPQLMVFENLCTSCGACADICPNDAVLLIGDKYIRDTAKCTNCGQCLPVCKAGAREMSGKMMTVKEVMDVVDRDSLFYGNSEGGVTFGGGEPTIGGEFLLELMRDCARKGYHITLDTCGVCKPEFFAKVLDYVDLFLFDCKHMDPVAHRSLTGLDNVLPLKNLKQVLDAGKDVQIRIPLMPGLNDSDENIAAIAALLKPYGKNEVDVLPCHLFGLNKYDALHMPRPTMVPYTTEGFKEALERFESHGLKTTIAD